MTTMKNSSVKEAFISDTVANGFRVISDRDTCGDECGLYLDHKTSRALGLKRDLKCEVVSMKGNVFRVLTSSYKDIVFEEPAIV